ESLRRLDFRMESPTPVPVPASQARPQKTRRPKGEGKPKDRTKRHYAVALTDLVSAGLLKPPVRLFRRYRGKAMEATLWPDGAVEFGGQRFDSCSTAAEHARSTVTGRRMHTNGWVFWQYAGDGGETRMLADVREKFLAMKGEGA